MSDFVREFVSDRRFIDSDSNNPDPEYIYEWVCVPLFVGLLSLSLLQSVSGIICPVWSNSHHSSHHRRRFILCTHPRPLELDDCWFLGHILLSPFPDRPTRAGEERGERRQRDGETERKGKTGKTELYFRRSLSTTTTDCTD